MSLQDLRSELEARITAGSLSFAAIGESVADFGLVIEELPPISDHPIRDARLTLSGQGADEVLTIAGIVDWELMPGTGATITVSADPTATAGHAVAVTLAAPDTVALDMPGVPWLSLGRFQIRARTEPATARGTGLVPQASLALATTVLIAGDGSRTPIPIVIGADPIGALLASLDTSAVVLPTINDALAVFGGGAHAIRLPATIDDLPGFSLRQLLIGFDPAARTLKQIGVRIGKDAEGGAGWPIIPGHFTLDRYAIDLDITDPMGTAKVGGQITAVGKLGSVDIGVSALHPATGGWKFSGYLGKSSGVPIGHLVGGLAAQFGVTLPEALASFTLNDFEFAFDTATHDASGRFGLDFDVNGTPVGLTVMTAFTRDQAEGGYSVVVDGSLRVGEATFTLAFGKSPSTFTASWEDAESPLGFADLAACFGFTDVPPIPEALDLDLVAATLSHDFGDGTLVITAVSKNPYYGSAVFVARAGAYFFGLLVPGTVDLTDLPLIHGVLGRDQSVGIRDIQVVIASEHLDETAAAAVNMLLGQPSLPQVPAKGMDAGLALSLSFQAGDYTAPLSLAIAAPGAERAAGPAAIPPEQPVPGPGSPLVPAAPSGRTYWYSLQKQFGPVTFQKIGIRYRSSGDGQDATLAVLMNAELGAGGLAITVLGLGAESPLTTFRPGFTIDGLAITYAEGPVALSGALVGAIEPRVEFYGELVLGAGELQMAALGGYTEVEGHPSFFLYAVLDYPIGGPAFLFVTGLAAGFGYNRRLVTPSVEQVAAFPLVRWAQGAGGPPMNPGSIAEAVAEVVSELSGSGVVAPSVGDHWLALGVRFTSFELVHSFALLTVERGRQFEVDLLGRSTVQLPPAPASPMARAELALKAAFVPDEGTLSVSGLLTPESFVLSPDCHLTGGFALAAWFSGDHAGQFVISLGGYSPRFDKPAHYPAVPRLGLAWAVSDELTVRGDLYFALTSSAVMAGGRLSAVWQGGGIRAWFEVEADFVLVFEPLHYHLSAGVHLGASFSVNLLFTSFTVSVHLGVTLELWGPAFTGRAVVDLSIISFTIGFGSSGRNTATTIGWADFLDKFMPSAAPQPGPADGLPRGRRIPRPLTEGYGGTMAADGGKPVAIVQIVPQGGLVKRLSDTDGDLNWVFNGEELRLATATAIPVKDWEFSDNVRLAPDAPPPNTDFGVGPVGVAGARFSSTHRIEITTGEPSLFRADPVVGNVPTALWQTRDFDHNAVPKNLDPLNGTTVEGVYTGFTLTPLATSREHTLPIPVADLDYAVASPIRDIAWTDATGPATDPFGGQTVWETIGAPGPQAVRGRLAAAVAAQGWPVPAPADVTELAGKAVYDLLADPVLRLLGEQR
ncbi:DUF6603 domain-containing protein [Actinomadura sp. WMMA1423]|uniref:DUF6603 domain-containing protein n=1 Tax=Actinomadura sp. WMMA1423 TaxID=2591108 RepID=UPI0011474430|nr:DUF6603 domain-containing protein [Actinomadura sp. WMMA1423]